MVLDNKTLLLWGLHILNFSSSPLSDLVSYASWVGGSFFPGGPLDISKFHFYFLQQAIRSSPTLGSCFSLESTTVKSLTPGVLAVQCCIINHPKHKHLFCLGLCSVVRAQQGQLVLPPWYLCPQLGDLNNGPEMAERWPALFPSNSLRTSPAGLSTWSSQNCDLRVVGLPLRLLRT